MMADDRDSLPALRRKLKTLADPARAKSARWYFKTGPGDYGEGDQFLGIRVPQLRGLVREYATLDRDAVMTLLKSPWHEERLLAVLVMVRHYERGSAADRQAVFALYLKSLRYINNWDIVDSSAPHIVGRHLDGRGRATLARLAKARSIWARRVAMLATFYTIKHDEFADTLAIATMLLKDEHDLIHKAVGWMLREVGQRDRATLTTFLARHAPTMPRTVLRYAIEKLPPAQRKAYRDAR